MLNSSSRRAKCLVGGAKQTRGPAVDASGMDIADREPDYEHRVDQHLKRASAEQANTVVVGPLS